MKIVEKIKKWWKKQNIYRKIIVIIEILILLFLFYQAYLMLSKTDINDLSFNLNESRCSMVHYKKFDLWWEENSDNYMKYGMRKEDFERFPFPEGIGRVYPVLFPVSLKKLKVGDVVVIRYGGGGLVHRVIKQKGGYIEVLGDNTDGNQLPEEWLIKEQDIIGKVYFVVPVDFLSRHLSYQKKCNSYLSDVCRYNCYEKYPHKASDCESISGEREKFFCYYGIGDSEECKRIDRSFFRDSCYFPLKMCGVIENQTIRDECYSKIVIDNVTKCIELEDLDYSKSGECFEEIKYDYLNCDKINNTLSREECHAFFSLPAKMRGYIFDSYDLSDCENIKYDYYREECYSVVEQT